MFRQLIAKRARTCLQLERCLFKTKKPATKMTGFVKLNNVRPSEHRNNNKALNNRLANPSGAQDFNAIFAHGSTDMKKLNDIKPSFSAFDL